MKKCNYNNLPSELRQNGLFCSWRYENVKGRLTKMPNRLDGHRARSTVREDFCNFDTTIKMFMFTGMRREELCGLEWKDIDFKTSVIRIERASLYIPHEGIITDTTKNVSSTRYIKSPVIAIQLLKEYKSWQAQRRLSMGDRWIDCDRLFTKPDGTPIHPDTLSSSAVLGRRIRLVRLDLAPPFVLSPPRRGASGDPFCGFRDFIQANDLPDISIHSLRHTNATLMINSGIPLTTIAARLGHADPTTTSKIYTHASSSRITLLGSGHV